MEVSDIAPARGAWVSSERMILLDRELDETWRRATLAHEICHVDLGHLGTTGHFARRAEREADHLAARRLLPSVVEIADAAATFRGDTKAIAHHLGVPVEVLVRRVERMHPRDVARIEARVRR